MVNSKEPIKLRKRKMSSGNTSLYLDIYREGKREYEYLHLYLIPETNRKAKETNRQTLQLAEAIKSKRIVEFQNGIYGFSSPYKSETNFLAYYNQMCEQRLHTKGSLGNWGNWWGALQHIKKYCSPETTFADITPEWVQGFKDYLSNTTRLRGHKAKDKNGKVKVIKLPLSQNTKASYFNKLRACINKAFDDGIIQVNPIRGIERFKEDETERVYLTLEEVRAMAMTECKDPILKRAFLFSCLTGLRKSDIEKMRWAEVQKQGDFTRVIFKQKKTKGQEYLDISPQAVEYLGERRSNIDLVFDGFKYGADLLKNLRDWSQRAGITKYITFHSGRHTFAVLMLDLGADIYTVQKLLGHKELHTTQIYANIMDKKKQAAVSLIPSVMPSVDLNSDDE